MKTARVSGLFVFVWLWSDDFVLSEEFSTYFEDAVRSLIVKSDEYYRNDMENLSDPVETAIRKCENIQVFKLLSKIFQLTRTFISLTLKSAIFLKKL